MIKLLHLVGARPQFVKMAALYRTFQSDFSNIFEMVLVHTGQHYDENMSAVFFKEMNIPHPDYNLEVGSGNHTHQTAQIMQALHPVLESEKPQAIVLYGDTNSTLAGAIVASKMNIPVVHVEAGLRSHNYSMPEEVNRVLVDRISSVLFCPSHESVQNLKAEGLEGNQSEPGEPSVFDVGDIMLDNCRFFAQDTVESDGVKQMLMTIHRDFNADNIQRLQTILETVNASAERHNYKVLFPVHPRTKKNLPAQVFSHIKMVEPFGFPQLMNEISNSDLVLTDSGGLQKEAYYLNKPVLVFRPESEWVELIESGHAKLVDADAAKIKSGIDQFLNSPPTNFPDIYGNGTTAKQILQHLKTIFD